jgi:hypothetical protein
LSIKLDSFDFDMIEQYFLDNILNNQFWLFASHAYETRLPRSMNSRRSAQELLEKTSFGLKYGKTDFSFMARFIPWDPNIVYQQYDDTKDLKDTSFYVLVEPEGSAGSHHVFKCISNNYNSPSISRPQFNPSISNGIYNLNDGYIWKYMTSIPSTLFRKFASRSLAPLVRNDSVENIAEEGIYNVIVENRDRNSGYERITGNIDSFEIVGSLATVFLKNLFSQTFQEIPVIGIENTFKDMALYIDKSSIGIGAEESTIIESGVTEDDVPFVRISLPATISLEENDRIEILPKVVITGNGTGASGIAEIESGSIKNIKMIDYGINYTSAIAEVLDPFSFDPTNQDRNDTRCLLRPVISPLGGHGSNLFAELNSNAIGLAAIITSADGNGIIPSAGSYSKLGIVKNPSFDIEGTVQDVNSLPSSNIQVDDIYFVTDENENYIWNGDEWVILRYFDNRIRFQLNSVPGNLETGDVVLQGNVRGTVNEIDFNNNYIYVNEYDGPYAETFDPNVSLEIKGIPSIINNIKFSKYQSRSGTVLSIIDVTPIERDEERSEQIRLILDF